MLYVGGLVAFEGGVRYLVSAVADGFGDSRALVPSHVYDWVPREREYGSRFVSPRPLVCTTVVAIP